MATYLVIGGTRGIGKSISEKLRAEGNHVVITSKQEYEAGGELAALEGLSELDGLVYCPGSIQLVPFTRISQDMFIDEMRINTYGALKAVQQSIGLLKKSEAPSVVFISSVAAQTGMPYHAMVAMAKGALESLTYSLAAELAPKIRVNCIAPSLVATDLSERFLNTEEKQAASAKRHPLGRYGTPHDIADSTLFLLSPKSGWVTGQVLSVDGGIGRLRMV